MYLSGGSKPKPQLNPEIKMLLLLLFSGLVACIILGETAPLWDHQDPNRATDYGIEGIPVDYSHIKPWNQT